MKYKWFGKRVRKLTFKRKLSRIKKMFSETRWNSWKNITEFSVQTMQVEFPFYNPSEDKK